MSSKRENNQLPPGQRPIKRLMRWGIDHPGITSRNPKIDIEKWTLVVNGEVLNPMKLSWNDFLKLPKVVSISDFHCVEGWSVLGYKWEGVRFKEIVDLAKPKENARFVTFECADGYTTSLTLEELSAENVLLAYRLNGQDLEEGLGWPMRLIVPDKYAYKSALWVTRIKFMSTKEPGYWEVRGYSDTADVWKNDRFKI
jgi:DMSO/TMAO reductase YedYZ molybdopterin-dependent catalytic subunit